MTPFDLTQLYGLKAHLDAVILLAEAKVQAGTPPGACPACGAPAEQVQDTSTLDGTKRSRCAACGHEWER